MAEYLHALTAVACNVADQDGRDLVRERAKSNPEFAAMANVMAAVLGRKLNLPSQRTREDASFQETMEAAALGDDQAVWDLIERYAGHVERVVRRKMDGRLRSKFDVEDFVQMVWVSFFRSPDRLRTFDSPQDVKRFLAAMARNKVIDENRRRLDTQKYDVQKETEMPGDSQLPPNLPQQDTPSQVAMARECWTRIMDTESERNQRIVSLRLSGWKYVEIADEVGLSERAIRKVIVKIFQKSGIANRHLVA